MRNWKTLSQRWSAKSTVTVRLPVVHSADLPVHGAFLSVCSLGICASTATNLVGDWNVSGWATVELLGWWLASENCHSFRLHCCCSGMRWNGGIRREIIRFSGGFHKSYKSVETHLSVLFMFIGARTTFESGMSKVGRIEESPVRASSSASVEEEKPSISELLWWDSGATKPMCFFRR